MNFCRSSANFANDVIICVSADIYREEQVREAFITGIDQIRQHLLNILHWICRQLSIKHVQWILLRKTCISNFPVSPNIVAAVNDSEETPSDHVKSTDLPSLVAIPTQFKKKCLFCNRTCHRKNCPASNVNISNV